MTHETFIVQIFTKRRWTNANYFDSLEEAKQRAKFYKERGHFETRIKEKNTNKIVQE